MTRWWLGLRRRETNKARALRTILHLDYLEDRTLPSLVAPVVYNTGQGPEGLAVGDLRGNGRLDIVTANTSAPSSVSVLLGNGNGTFQPAVDYATGGSDTQFVALGKLGRGGTLDIITANRGSDTVSVLLGNGDGTFQPAVQYSVGLNERPIAVAVGDFTGVFAHHFNRLPAIRNGQRAKLPHIFRQGRRSPAFRPSSMAFNRAPFSSDLWNSASVAPVSIRRCFRTNAATPRARSRKWSGHCEGR